MRKERCDPDCQMLVATEDRMIKQCAFTVIALQLDELAKKARGKFQADSTLPGGRVAFPRCKPQLAFRRDDVQQLLP